MPSHSLKRRCQPESHVLLQRLQWFQLPQLPPPGTERSQWVLGDRNRVPRQTRCPTLTWKQRRCWCSSDYSCKMYMITKIADQSIDTLAVALLIHCVATLPMSFEWGLWDSGKTDNFARFNVGRKLRHPRVQVNKNTIVSVSRGPQLTNAGLSHEWRLLAPYRCRTGWCTLCSPREDPCTQPSHAPTNCSASASAGSRCYRWRYTSTTGPTPATDPPLGRCQMRDRHGNGCRWQDGVLIRNQGRYRKYFNIIYIHIVITVNRSLMSKCIIPSVVSRKIDSRC